MKTVFPNVDRTIFLGLAVLVATAANIALSYNLSQAARAAADPFGSLSITFLTTPDCSDCFDLSPLRDYFKQNGVEDSQIKEVAYDSKEGKKMIKDHDIQAVPTAVIPGDLADLDYMTGIVQNLGQVKNGAFVLTKLQPPYRDLSDNSVVGRFDLIVVADASCTTCYSTDLHDQVLDRLAMKPQSKKVVDISSDEGKALVESYAITAVPTILLRGDLAPYTDLQDIWSSVGTKEDDGTYVLRQGVENMGVYKHLPDGAIIEPKTQNN